MLNRQLNRFVTPVVAAGLLLYTTAAEAYIGPGAGLSLLGALWALIAAIVAALGFIVLWPLRKARKRRLAQKNAATAAEPPAAADHAAVRQAAPDAMDKAPETPTR
jgi:type VI protein secretion system component VasK